MNKGKTIKQIFKIVNAYNELQLFTLNRKEFNELDVEEFKELDVVIYINKRLFYVGNSYDALLGRLTFTYNDDVIREIINIHFYETNVVNIFVNEIEYKIDISIY